MQMGEHHKNEKKKRIGAVLKEVKEYVQMWDSALFTAKIFVFFEINGG